MKIAVIVHLYWVDLWPEIAMKLKHINHHYDLYVTITEGSYPPQILDAITKSIKTFKKNTTILRLENRGMDIGPLFMVMKKIIESNKTYNYYLKLHTKKSLDTRERNGVGLGEAWRKELMEPICGSINKVDECINLLKQKDIGMVGSKHWLINAKIHRNALMSNHNIIQDYINRFKFKNLTPEDCEFIGGTMFWVKGLIWEEFFKKINISKEYKKFCPGKFTDHNNPTHTHSMERFFSLIVKNNNMKIIGVE